MVPAFIRTWDHLPLFFFFFLVGSAAQDPGRPPTRRSPFSLLETRASSFPPRRRWKVLPRLPLGLHRMTPLILCREISDRSPLFSFFRVDSGSSHSQPPHPFLCALRKAAAPKTPFFLLFFFFHSTLASQAPPSLPFWLLHPVLSPGCARFVLPIQRHLRITALPDSKSTVRSSPPSPPSHFRQILPQRAASQVRETPLCPDPFLLSLFSPT